MIAVALVQGEIEQVLTLRPVVEAGGSIPKVVGGVAERVALDDSSKEAVPEVDQVIEEGVEVMKDREIHTPVVVIGPTMANVLPMMRVIGTLTQIPAGVLHHVRKIGFHHRFSLTVGEGRV